jgi:hypothetical protein
MMPPNLQRNDRFIIMLTAPLSGHCIAVGHLVSDVQEDHYQENDPYNIGPVRPHTTNQKYVLMKCWEWTIPPHMIDDVDTLRYYRNTFNKLKYDVPSHHILIKIINNFCNYFVKIDCPEYPPIRYQQVMTQTMKNYQKCMRQLVELMPEKETCFDEYEDYLPSDFPRTEVCLLVREIYMRSMEDIWFGDI